MFKLRYTLIATRKIGAPGCDNITNQALKNLDPITLLLPVAEYNKIRLSGQVPGV